MLTIEKKVDEQGTVILHLKGELTIETVIDLREALLEAFAEPQAKVQLDGHDLASIDFFGLQLLCSAHRTAIAQKKMLTWRKGRLSHLSDSVQLTGFSRHCGCTLCPPNVDCMWV
ncbi:MAG: STAS domain-containing protein [Desulfobulbus sp.]